MWMQVAIRVTTTNMRIVSESMYQPIESLSRPPS